MSGFDPSYLIGHSPQCPRREDGSYLCAPCLTCGWRGLTLAGAQHVNPTFGPLCYHCRLELPSALVEAICDQYTEGARERLGVAAEWEAARQWAEATGRPVAPGEGVDAVALLRASTATGSGPSARRSRAINYRR